MHSEGKPLHASPPSWPGCAHWLRGWAPMRSASKTCARSATSLDPQHGVVVMESCHFIRVFITRSSRRRCGQINEVQRPGGGGGGGYSDLVSDGGMPLKPPNLYPSLRVILMRKGYPLLLCSSWMSSASIWEENSRSRFECPLPWTTEKYEKKKEPFCEDL